MLYDYTSMTADRIAEIANDAIAQADTLVAAAVASFPRTWADTIAPLEEAGTIMGDAYGQSPFMARVHPDKTVRDRATEIDEQLTKWGTDLMFRQDLFATVKEYSATDRLSR
jgi:Zn-dependent oligopeptidase